MIVHYVVANAEGEITASGHCLAAELAEGMLPAPAGVTGATHYVAQGALVAYSDSQRAAKAAHPGVLATWSNVTMQWVDQRTELQRLAAAAAALRQRRDALLAKTDWTVGNDSPFDAQQRAAWAAWRDALRRLPESPGWPNVVIPAAPGNVG